MVIVAMGKVHTLTRTSRPCQPGKATCHLHGMRATCNTINATEISLFLNVSEIKYLTLKCLHVEVLPKAVFEKFRSLEILKIKYGRVTQITNGTFEKLENLKQLHLHHIRLSYLESGSFSNLTKLETLEITKNKLPMSVLGHSLASLPKGTIRSLNISSNGVVNGHLDDSFTESLQNTTLTSLNISKNKLYTIDSGFFKTVHSLESLDLSQNFLINAAPRLLELEHLQNLTYIDVSYQETFIGPIPYNIFFNKWQANDDLFLSRNVNNCFFRVRLPVRLKVVLARGILASIPANICVFPNNILSILDLSDTSLPSVGQQFLNLPNLTHLNLEKTRLRKISDNFVQNMPFLEALILNQNDIGHLLEKDRWLLGKNLSLAHLELSDTRTRVLSQRFLHSISRVKHLILANNTIKTLNTETFTGLETLDLRNNQILYIHKSFMDNMDRLSEKHVVSVNLLLNPLTRDRKCCDIQDFITWCKKNKTVLLNWKQYRCFFQDQAIFFDSIDIHDFETDCVTLERFAIIPIVSGSLVLLVTAVAVAYRKRWRLAECFFSIEKMLSLKRSYHGDLSQAQFPFDVFIAYHSNKLSWVVGVLIPRLRSTEFNLRVCFDQLHFVPGLYIQENIDRCMLQSRKVLVIIDNDFIDSRWCMYELEQSRNLEVDDRRTVLIPVLFGDLNIRNTNFEIRSMLNAKVYLEWTENCEGQALFWRKLIDAIQS